MGDSVPTGGNATTVGIDVAAPVSASASEFQLLTTYAAIVSMACTCVYIGAQAALGQAGPREDKDGNLSQNGQNGENGKNGGGWEVEKTETMTQRDALKFPLIGSAVLLTLYGAFKFLPKDLLNNLLTAYFLLFGVFAVAWTLKPLAMVLLPASVRVGVHESRKKYTLKPEMIFGDEPLELDYIDMVLIGVAIAFGGVYWKTKHWILSNVLGVAFSVQGIAMLNLGSFKTGCILLSGLFFYDIWWVFGTEVMVTVAKSFDVPIKLLWPRDWSAEQMEFSMLGLGDIVIPGVFVALLLRFDARNAQLARLSAQKKPVPAHHRDLPPVPHAFARPYFYAVYAGYVAGLVATIVVMHVFQAAQPALLYLVPTCILSAVACGVVRGELPALWAYSEEESEDETKQAADGKPSSTKVQGKRSSSSPSRVKKD